jgi:pimeloyl-ACP methyl ester carboxylesterase
MTAATNLAGLEPKDLVTGGISIHYYTGGEGEPLLLLHGLAGASGNWVELLPDLLQRHRVIAVDLPGHAGSAKAPRGTSMDDFAAVAAGVLEAEVERPALVAGHSLGGLVALRLARARPELVCGLLLVSPAGIRTTTRLTRSLVLASTTVRPGRWVAPLRHRYAGRAWYRRAFSPWFVSDATTVSERATARPARCTARPHGHEDRCAGDERRRPAPRPR